MRCRTVLLVLGVAAVPVAAAGQPPRSPSLLLEEVTEDIAQARGREAPNSKGGPGNNELSNVDEPTRAGRAAFRHRVTRKGERSELAMSRAEIGGSYWYGWSLLLPEDFDHTGSKTIVMQLASWPTPRNGRFPCNANGPFMEVQPDGRLVMHLQHRGDDRDMVCDEFTVAEDVAPMKGRWADFVMFARWTGGPDGTFRLWCRPANGSFRQVADHRGRTWWDDEGAGPYFKMGAYMGDPGWEGRSPRVLFTDEYRMGDASSGFEAVAPGGGTAP